MLSHKQGFSKRKSFIKGKKKKKKKWVEWGGTELDKMIWNCSYKTMKETDIC